MHNTNDITNTYMIRVVYTNEQLWVLYISHFKIYNKTNGWQHRPKI